MPQRKENGFVQKEIWCRTDLSRTFVLLALLVVILTLFSTTANGEGRKAGKKVMPIFSKTKVL